MLYHLDFCIEYAATMSPGDLFAIWSREADAALGANSAGVVVDVDGPDTLDRILLDPPIMKAMGQHVHGDVTPLRRYEDVAAHVKQRLAS